MAGKEIYIGRMLESLNDEMTAVSVSMANVSADIQKTTDILSTILANMGLQKNQVVYSGASLVALNPILTPKYNYNFAITGTHIIKSFSEGYSARYPMNDTGSGATSFSENAIAHLTAEEFNKMLENGFKVSLSVHSTVLPIKNCATGNWVQFAYTDVNGSSGNKIVLSSSGQIGSSSTLNFNKIVDVAEGYREGTSGRLYKAQAGTTVTLYINMNASGLENTQVNYACNIFDADGVSIIDSAQILTDDDVYTMDGAGSLLFTLTESAAAQLSDAVISARLNEGDTVSLLDTEGGVVAADTGLIVPLSAITGNSFKLLIEMSDGAIINTIAVRYY